MRTSLRRVLAGTSAVTVLSAGLILGAASPAAALNSDYCPQATSTRLVTANDGDYKVWLYQPTSSEVTVCFGIGSLVRGVVRFKTGVTGSLIPTVTPATDDPDCPGFVHLQDPVDVLLNLQAWVASSPYYLCFGTDGNAVRVTVTQGPGSVDPVLPYVWLDRGTTFYAVYCQYVNPTGPACSLGNDIWLI